MQNTRLFISIIIFATLSRLVIPLGHIPNFSALDALALFCGAYGGRRSVTIPVILLSVWLGDILMTHTLTYPGWYWQYGSYVLISSLGSTLQNRTGIFSVSAASFGSAILFFVVTNFGVWFGNLLYPLTLSGLIDCYVAAIPFFKYTLASDLIFSAILFGSRYVIKMPCHTSTATALNVSPSSGQYPQMYHACQSTHL